MTATLPEKSPKRSQDQYLGQNAAGPVYQPCNQGIYRNDLPGRWSGPAILRIFYPLAQPRFKAFCVSSGQEHVPGWPDLPVATYGPAGCRSPPSGRTLKHAAGVGEVGDTPLEGTGGNDRQRDREQRQQRQWRLAPEEVTFVVVQFAGSFHPRSLGVYGDVSLGTLPYDPLGTTTATENLGHGPRRATATATAREERPGVSTEEAVEVADGGFEQVGAGQEVGEGAVLVGAVAAGG